MVRAPTDQEHAMNQPVHRYNATASTVVDVLIVVLAVALTFWTLTDDTLPEWFIRLGIGAAIVAAAALTLQALHRLSGRP